VKEETFGKGAPRGNPPARTQLFAAEGEAVIVQRKKKPSGAQRKRLRKQKEATAAQQAGGGPGARGVYSGKLCTGTEGQQSHKKPLSPGGTLQGTQN